MAFVTWDSLQSLDLPLPTGTTSDDGKLRTCTAAEDATSSPFYVEDIIRVASQEDFDHLRKQMAKYWDETHQVWVGYTAGGDVLKDVIALRCPPYYPPHTFASVDVSSMSKPTGFP